MLGINQTRLFSSAFCVQEKQAQPQKPVLKTLDKDTVSFKGGIVSAGRFKEALALTRGHIKDQEHFIKVESELAAARFAKISAKDQAEKAEALKNYLKEGPPPSNFKVLIGIIAENLGVKMPNYSEKFAIKSPHPKLSDIPPILNVPHEPWDSHLQRQWGSNPEEKLNIQTSDPWVNLHELSESKNPSTLH